MIPVQEETTFKTKFTDTIRDVNLLRNILIVDNVSSEFDVFRTVSMIAQISSRDIKNKNKSGKNHINHRKACVETIFILKLC